MLRDWLCCEYLVPSIWFERDIEKVPLPNLDLAIIGNHFGDDAVLPRCIHLHANITWAMIRVMMGLNLMV